MTSHDDTSNWVDMLKLANDNQEVLLRVAEEARLLYEEDSTST